MKLVTFTVADKEYAAEVSLVREVIRMRPAIPVPESAPFVEGVIKLRGRIVPVINLRVKLGLERQAADRLNRIIITHVGESNIGIVVDKVFDVVNIPDSSIEAPDEILKEAAYLIGVAKAGSRVILLVDFVKLLSSEDHQSLADIHAQIEIKKTT